MKLSIICCFVFFFISFQAKAGLSVELGTAFFANYLYDDNFNRAASNNSSSAKIKTLGAVISTDLRYYRQHVSAKLTFFDVGYNTFDFLNYQGGIGELKWDWFQGRRWFGDINLMGSRQRTENSDYIYRDDEISQLTTGIALKYKFTPRWRMGLRGKYNQLEHSSENFAIANRRVFSLRTALHYISAARNDVNGFIEVLNGQFPERGENVNLAKEYYQLHTGAQLVIIPRKNDRLLMQLGFLGRDNKQSLSDFTGITGKFSYQFTPSNKTQMELRLNRDVINSDEEEANYYVRYAASAELTWSITVKTQVFSEVAFNRKQFNLSNTKDREDTEKIFEFGLSHMPVNILTAQLKFKNINKSSTVTLLNYQANQVSAEVTLQF